MSKAEQLDLWAPPSNIITLYQVDINRADDVAARRTAFAIRNNLRNRFLRPGETNPHSYALDRVTCRTEVAGQLYLNPCRWLDYTENLTEKKPELDDFIDVKAIERAHHKLAVQTYDQPSWAYLLVDASEHPRYRICGWLWGHEAQRHPVTDPAERHPAHFVHQRFLRSPESLIAVLRERQLAREF